MSGTTAEIPLNAEEREAIIRAQRTAMALASTVGMAPQPAESPMTGRNGDEPVSIVTVTKAFILKLQNRQKVAFPVGTYPALTRYADHWWSKANGLTQVSQEMMRMVLPVELLPAADQGAVLKQRAEVAVKAAYAAMAAAKAAGVEIDIPPVPAELMESDRPPEEPAPPPVDPPPAAPPGTAEVPAKPAGFTDEQLAELDVALNDPARPVEVTPAEWVEQNKRTAAAGSGGSGDGGGTGGTGGGDDTGGGKGKGKK